MVWTGSFQIGPSITTSDPRSRTRARVDSPNASHSVSGGPKHFAVPSSGRFNSNANALISLRWVNRSRFYRRNEGGRFRCQIVRSSPASLVNLGWKWASLITPSSASANSEIVLPLTFALDENPQRDTAAHICLLPILCNTRRGRSLFERIPIRILDAREYYWDSADP